MPPFLRLMQVLTAAAALALIVSCAGPRAGKPRETVRKKNPCTYEEVRFVGVFVDSLQGVGQFERLKGGSELIVLDSVKITGKLVRDAMVRVSVRRSPGGTCGATTGSISRM